MNWRKNPEYWGKAGAGIIPLAKSTKRFLIPLRSGHVLEPHTYGTIGGKLDSLYDEDMDYDDWDEPQLEDPETAALREFEEETGQSSRKIKTLIPLLVFEDESVGFQYFNFLGVVNDEFDAISNWETDHWEWVTFEELLELDPLHFGLEAVLADEHSLGILQSWV